MYIDFDGMGTHDVINVGHTRNNAKDAATVRFSPIPYLFVFVLLHVCIIAFVTTAPGIPQVFVQQAEDGATVLSWRLKCKNGIIEKYLVTYFDMDDTSDDESLSTPETEQRIQKLIAGKTYEFQVSCYLSYYRTVSAPGNDLLVIDGQTD